MADIKTKDNAKGTIRTIDKAAVATQRMKQAYIATKEKAERSVNANSSSAEEYASDKLEAVLTRWFTMVLMRLTKRDERDLKPQREYPHRKGRYSAFQATASRAVVTKTGFA